jgi:iron complex transport system substrate-binding protein
VFTFNQRSVAEILQMICVLGAIIGAAEKAEALARDLAAGLESIRTRARGWKKRPRVYFEEWPDPLISGIQWVEELVEIAGGIPVFPALRHARLGKDRIVTSAQVVAAAPDVIIASWCGKPVRKEKVAARPGWESMPAVRNGHIYEVKSTFILQPGPASLTEGVTQLHRIFADYAAAPRDYAD